MKKQSAPRSVGRPALGKKARNSVVSIRLTESEFALAERLTKKWDCSLSELFRRLLTGKDM